MTTTRRFFTALGRAFEGLAYAELGEHLPQRDKEAILTGVTPARLTAPEYRAARPERRVALAVQGRVQPGALHYARNACDRLEADLDILTNLAEPGLRDLVDAERRELIEAGHRVEVIRLGRDLLRGVVHYARVRSGLLFVVVSADDRVAERVMAGSGDCRRLDVPWVVVAAADPV